MNRFATASTRETPETACSPTVETMMVSIIPIVTDRSVSIISGTISFLRYLLSNRRDFPSISSAILII